MRTPTTRSISNNGIQLRIPDLNRQQSDLAHLPDEEPAGIHAVAPWPGLPTCNVSDYIDLLEDLSYWMDGIDTCPPYKSVEFHNTDDSNNWPLQKEYCLKES